jgi:hypothetical protein
MKAGDSLYVSSAKVTRVTASVNWFVKTQKQATAGLRLSVTNGGLPGIPVVVTAALEAQVGR